MKPRTRNRRPYSTRYLTLTRRHEQVPVRGEGAAEELGGVSGDLSLAVGEELAVDGALVRLREVMAAAADIPGLQGRV